MSAVSRFQGLVGKGLSLVELAAPFASCGTSPCKFYPFPTAEMEAVRRYGAIPFFSWSSAGGGADEAFRFANLIGGSYDSYIRSFAEAAKAWGHPFFLRFDWEMNGDWFPWSEGVNGNQAGEFVTAWRHVHDIFAAVGATNATWVWCPYSEAQPRFGALSSLYPGSGYVDWTCLDGFNWAGSSVNPQPWRSFDQIFDASYRTVVGRVAPDKPMLLAELASIGADRAKAIWIGKMFRMLAVKYRRVRGLIWFDRIDRGVAWPIETSPAVAAAFARGVGRRAYRANAYAAIADSPISPPR